MNIRIITVALLSAAIGVLPAVSYAQPFIPRGGPSGRGGPGFGGPGRGPGGPGFGGPRHYSSGRGAGVAAGIIGLAAGAMMAGAAAQAQARENAHVNRCFNAYRSYDPDTDTYVDRYGRIRPCRL